MSSPASPPDAAADTLEDRVKADHQQRQTEHITHGVLADLLATAQRVLGPLHASDLRVHPHPTPERTRVTVRAAGRYTITLADAAAQQAGHQLPCVQDELGCWPITRPADLLGRDTPHEAGLRLTPASARDVNQLARPESISPALLAASLAVFAAGAVSIPLALSNLISSDLSMAQLAIVILASVQIIAQFIRRERQRRTRATFEDDLN